MPTEYHKIAASIMEAKNYDGLILIEKAFC